MFCQKCLKPHLNVHGIVNKHKKETKTVMQLAYEAVVPTLSIIRSSRKIVFCQAVAIRNSCPQMFHKIATLKILKIPGNLQSFRDSSVSKHFEILLL